MLFFSMAISFIVCGGGGENDENLPADNYPRYPRIKKMKNGDYILFYHNGSANNNIGRRCVYALSKDLRTWTKKGEIFNSYDIIDSKGNKNIHCYANCDGPVLSNGDILAVVSTSTARWIPVTGL